MGHLRTTSAGSLFLVHPFAPGLAGVQVPTVIFMGRVGRWNSLLVVDGIAFGTFSTSFTLIVVDAGNVL